MKHLKLPSPLVAAFAVVLSGCVTNLSERTMEDYEINVDMIRDYIMESNSPDDLLRSATATTEERQSKYNVVYLDAKCVSYRCDDWAYTGGAHGMTTVHVGTLDRKTGRKLALDDVFPKDGQGELARTLRGKATEALARKQQQLFDYVSDGELLTDNFCLMEDGWHFVYSPYDIAPFAAGVVEIVIPKTP